MSAADATLITDYDASRLHASRCRRRRHAIRLFRRRYADEGQRRRFSTYSSRHYYLHYDIFHAMPPAEASCQKFRCLPLSYAFQIRQAAISRLRHC